MHLGSVDDNLKLLEPVCLAEGINAKWVLITAIAIVEITGIAFLIYQHIQSRASVSGYASELQRSLMEHKDVLPLADGDRNQGEFKYKRRSIPGMDALSNGKRSASRTKTRRGLA